MIKYNAPELEVITFNAEDIITASVCDVTEVFTEYDANQKPVEIKLTCDLEKGHGGEFHHDPVVGNWMPMP